MKQSVEQLRKRELSLGFVDRVLGNWLRYNDDNNNDDSNNNNNNAAILEDRN
jgi:hypothetical protein